MIEETIARLFREHGWTWRLKGGKVVVPDEDDVLAALEEAAKQLVKEPVGTQLQVGRLIIEKKQTGHDVFAFVGEYL